MREARCDICGNKIPPYETDIARIKLDTSFAYDTLGATPVHKTYEVCDFCIGSVKRQIFDLKRFFEAANKGGTL